MWKTNRLLQASNELYYVSRNAFIMFFLLTVNLPKTLYYKTERNGGNLAYCVVYWTCHKSRGCTKWWKYFFHHNKKWHSVILESFEGLSEKRFSPYRTPRMSLSYLSNQSRNLKNPSFVNCGGNGNYIYKSSTNSFNLKTGYIRCYLSLSI